MLRARSMIGLLLAGLLLPSCGPNIKGIVESLASSDRSWCLALNGYGADLKVGGSGVDTGDMVCGGSGLVLKSQGTQIGVPLTIVPQLSVGAPTVVSPPPPPPPRPAPRVVPQGAPPRGVDDVTLLRPIAWQPAEPRPAPAPLTADERLLLFTIGDLHHRRGP